MPCELPCYSPTYIPYASKCELKHGAHCHAKIPLIDSLGNIITQTEEEQKKQDEFIPETDFTDSAVFNVLNIPQLFYIEKNKLKVFIPHVTTERCITTSQGVRLGPASYFDAAFNFNRLYTETSKNKIIFLQQTTKNIRTDSMFIGFETYQVKQLYERDLIGTLCWLLRNEKLSLASPVTNKAISMSTLNEILIPETKIPLYDSVGNITSGIYFYTGEISPSVFKEIQIIQKWYYNETKNIVFCDIPQITLYAYRSKDGEYEKELSPVARIFFKN